MKKNHRSRHSIASFTLVELLTATVILALLVLLFGQIVILASRTTDLSRKNADALDQGRVTLDRFGIDWDARSRRSDLAPIFTNAGGWTNYSDIAVFTSQVPGFGVTSTARLMSQVAYYITNSPSYSLNRWVKGAMWTSSQLQFYPVFSPSFYNDNNYQTLASEVCRMQFCFLSKSTGQIVAYPLTNSGDLGGVGVSLAVLDKETRGKVTSSQIQTLVTSLANATNGSTAADQWNAFLNSDRASASPSNAKLILQNVRIYQRTYYTY